MKTYEHKIYSYRHKIWAKGSCIPREFGPDDFSGQNLKFGQFEKNALHMALLWESAVSFGYRQRQLPPKHNEASTPMSTAQGN